MVGHIVRLDAAELVPGRLGECFRAGAVAAIISGAPAVSGLEQRLLAEPATMPWTSPLYQLATNLLPNDDLTEALGDVYYFKPGRHSYIARKLEIMAQGATLAVRPSGFRTGEEDQPVPADLVADCWQFCSLLLASLRPLSAGSIDTGPPVRVCVQRLKYADSQASHQALFAMVRNSLGPWARIGYALDRRREEMRGPLGRRGVSDALALLELVPLMHRPIGWLNGVAARHDTRGNLPPGASLLVKAHLDTRYFSALCGTRHNLQTEVWAGNRWLPLPLNHDDVAVMPGAIAQKRLGIKATLHRVLQTDAQANDGIDPRLRNVTLLLGAK